MFLLDTADVTVIKKGMDIYSLVGVTTNPSIIAKENKNPIKLLTEIGNLIGTDKMLHAQVIGTKADQMVAEAKFLEEQIGGNVYIKIPVIPEGIKAIKLLKQVGINTTATAVFTPQQAFMAAQAGASFVAPYVNRLDNISAGGVQVISEIAKLFVDHNLDTKILAASFRNVEQIHQSYLAGAEAITASYDLIEQLVYHPMTESGVAQFRADWKKVYGENKLITDFNS